VDKASDALQSLVGYNWGQFGDVVFYTIGAYRNKAQKVVIFGYVESP